jgi:hypothetical protein
VLDAEKYAKTQELAETARDFCDKVARLSDTVATVVDAVDRQVRLGHRHPTDPSSASNVLQVLSAKPPGRIVPTPRRASRVPTRFPPLTRSPHLLTPSPPNLSDARRERRR